MHKTQYTAEISKRANLRLKKEEEDRLTHQKMKSFFENKLFDVVRVDPILDEREKTC